MRRTFIIIVIFPASAMALPTIKPVIPIVYVGSNTVITSTEDVEWSLSSGSTGTLTNSAARSVTYNAPGPIATKQTLYGCVVSPNDMIWNTNISALPVNTSSTNYVRAQAGDAQIAMEADMPINIYGADTPSYSMVFNYTPGNNGSFKIVNPYDLRVENGVFADKDVDKDTHILAIDTNTCTASELYKLYPIGTQGDCLSCNSQSGVTYTNRYNIVQGPTAGGLPITSLMLKYKELRDCVDRGIPITHALRMTFSVGILSNTYKWPAVAAATDGGQLPFGTYLRLVSTYTVTGSAAAQCVQTALKNYGAIVDDGGINGHVQVEQSAIADYDLFDALMNELNGISEFKVRNLESVDVSSLRDSDPNSATFNTGRAVSATASNYAVIIASNTTTHQVSSMTIIVQPVSIGTEREVGYSFMAGASQYRIPLWVKGSTDTTFSCAMNPSLGSLTSDGLYTPPANGVSGRSTTTVTCAATTDASAKITFPLIVYSTSGVRVRLANASNSNYSPDVNGDTWYAERGAFWRLQGHANCDWSGETWSGVTDSGLYKQCQYVQDGSGDFLHRFIVPNGNYHIKLHFAVGGGASPFSSDEWVMGLDSQDSIYSGSGASTIAGNGAWTFFGLTGKKFDLCDVTGSCASQVPGTITLNKAVTNGDLYFAVRHLTINGSSSRKSSLNAFSITFDSALSPAPSLGTRLFGKCKFRGRTNIR